MQPPPTRPRPPSLLIGPWLEPPSLRSPRTHRFSLGRAPSRHSGLRPAEKSFLATPAKLPWVRCTKSPRCAAGQLPPSWICSLCASLLGCKLLKSWGHESRGQWHDSGARNPARPRRCTEKPLMHAHAPGSWSYFSEVMRLVSGRVGPGSCQPGAKSVVSRVYSRNEHLQSVFSVPDVPPGARGRECPPLPMGPSDTSTTSSNTDGTERGSSLSRRRPCALPSASQAARLRLLLTQPRESTTFLCHCQLLWSPPSATRPLLTSPPRPLSTRQHHRGHLQAPPTAPHCERHRDHHSC